MNDVRSIDSKYNENYLRAEYNFVSASAVMAAKWEGFAEDGDRYNLQYRTQKDERVRPEHAALDGVTLPPSDPFWEEFYPPNGWNCFTGLTPVLTASGWRYIYEVKQGELVVGGSGQFRKVIGTHSRSVDEELVRIVTERGIATCTKNHRFCTRRGWVIADELKPGDVVIQIAKDSPLDKVINAVCNSITLVKECLMSLERKWKPVAPLAINDEFKGRDDEIGNIGSYDLTLLEDKGFIHQICLHDFFGFTQWLSDRTHSLGMSSSRGLPGSTTLDDDLPTPKRRRSLKFFGDITHKLTVLLGLSLSYMSAFKCKAMVKLRKILAGFKPTLIRTNPLRPDCGTPFTDHDPARAQNPHGSSKVDMPVRTEPSEAALLNDIPMFRGIRKICSFNGFDSFFDFIGRSFFHTRYVVIQGKVRIKKGVYQVYNLSVEEDESYIVPVGIAHNCRCNVVQVRKSKYPATPHDEAMRLGDEALQRDSKGIFRFNPGLEQKTVPDYNPYTIRRCRDCDIAKGKKKLARITPPDNQLCQACRFLHECRELDSEIIPWGKGTIEISNLVSRKDNDFERLMQVARHFASQGEEVFLSPKMTRPSRFDYDCIYGSLKGTVYYGKCPDLKIGEHWYEHEGFVSNNHKRAFSNMVNHGMKQSARIIIDKPDLTDAYMKRIIQQRIMDGHQISEVWLREGDKLRLLYKKSEE